MKLNGYWKHTGAGTSYSAGRATMKLSGYWKIERKKTGGRLGTSHHYFAWLLKVDRFQQGYGARPATRTMCAY